MFKRIAVLAVWSLLAAGALAKSLPSTSPREQSGQPKPQSEIGQRTREVLTDATIDWPAGGT